MSTTVSLIRVILRSCADPATDSSVHKRANPDSVVTQAAYLLFYRRRSAGPLGPPELQKMVNDWRNPDYDAAEESEEEESRNLSPAGNGSRLGDSSRNGSSSAFGAGAGAAVLRGGGSGAAGSLAAKGAAAVSRDDDDMDDPPPMYDADEGFHDADDDDMQTYMNPTDIASIYAPLSQQTPVWDFSGIGNRTTTSGTDDVFDETASDAPNLGEDLNDRMLEDFGDDEIMAPGQSTPINEEVPALLGPQGDDDGPVAEIHIKAD